MQETELLHGMDKKVAEDEELLRNVVCLLA